MTAVEVDTYGFVSEPPSRGGFWFLLVAGVAWLVLALLVLQFTYTSVRALTFLVSVFFFVAAASEFGETFVAPSWRWAHAVLGTLFVAGGIWAIVYPGETFGTLALLFGWYLLLKGVHDLVVSLALRGIALWWIGLLAGAAQIALAFWATGYPGRSAALLVLWVGIGAAVRGLVTVVAAFRLRDETGA